jgi:phenylpropionate dioxygenase-like ring-hydroxylating dioxygenase large terminal subunit
MDHAKQVATLKRLLAYVDGKTTALAPAPWENDVTSFISPDILQQETETLFRKYPVMVGLSCDWPKPGTYRTDDFAGVPMLIARDRAGKLHAFLNVCRHRGAKVADGCGSASVFSCPYHAWTYGLDGSLRGIPDEAAFPGVRAQRSGLTPLPICERYGIVWVMPRPSEDYSGELDIDAWLGGLGPELATWKIDTYHTYDRRTVNETMNWKLSHRLPAS